MKITREFYVRKDYMKVISMTGTELYMKTIMSDARPKTFAAMGFSGKKAKYDFWSTFQTMEARQAYVCKWENNLRAWDKKKQDQKDARKAPSTLTEGTILYTSWGYDQTNIDFYQVTKIVSKRMVEIRQIGAAKEYTNHMAGNVTPIKDKFISEPIRKMANAENIIKIASYASAWPWDGRAKYFSEYA